MSTVSLAAIDVSKISVSSVTCWDGRKTRRFTRLADPIELAEMAAAADDSPIWVELSLDSDPTAWFDPWDPVAGAADWSEVRAIARELGFGLPDEPGGQTDAVAGVLARLPRINELGELGWLERELEHMDQPAAVLPLAGFRPTSTLDRPPTDVAALEFVLLRVNLAVVGRYVFTIRLPDRLCSGVRLHEGRRVSAADHCPELPELQDFRHYLAPGERPSANDVAAALALYLSATCACVAEYARRRLVEIESAALGSDATAVEGGGRKDDPGRLGQRFTEVFETRGALQAAEEELVRLVQRQFDVDLDSVDFRRDARARYESALKELRAAEEELRLMGDWLTNRTETLQAQHASEIERRDKDRQLMLTVVGTLLIVPTLVASVFNEDTKLPSPKSAAGLVGMVLLMVGLGGIALFVMWRRFGPSEPAEPGPSEPAQSEAIARLIAHPATLWLSIVVFLLGVGALEMHRVV